MNMATLCAPPRSATRAGRWEVGGVYITLILGWITPMNMASVGVPPRSAMQMGRKMGLETLMGRSAATGTRVAFNVVTAFNLRACMHRSAMHAEGGVDGGVGRRVSGVVGWGGGAGSRGHALHSIKTPQYTATVAPTQAHCGDGATGKAAGCWECREDPPVLERSERWPTAAASLQAFISASICSAAQHSAAQHGAAAVR